MLFYLTFNDNLPAVFSSQYVESRPLVYTKNLLSGFYMRSNSIKALFVGCIMVFVNNRMQSLLSSVFSFNRNLFKYRWKTSKDWWECNSYLKGKHENFEDHQQESITEMMSQLWMTTYLKLAKNRDVNYFYYDCITKKNTARDIIKQSMK